MSSLKTSIRHLTREDYQTKPWKNGKGQTQDVFLIPEDADHSNFDLRFALSPIVTQAQFSSFPGADRVISVIEGDTLELAFETETVLLNRYDSHRFDTGLSPIGKPLGDPIRVVNVMARRNIWSIIFCKLVSTINVTCGANNLLFIYAISGDCSVTVDGEKQHLCPTETLITFGPAQVDGLSKNRFLVSQLALV